MTVRLCGALAMHASGKDVVHAARVRPAGVSKPRLRLLHHLARTGGTLISRCIGSMRGVVLLSEVHPFGMRQNNPLAQAQCWYALFDAAECRELEVAGAMSFAEAIARIERAAARRGATLVIRDWPHLDFTGVPWELEPPMRLRTAEALAERFDLVQTATVRHPLDSWLSLSAQGIMRGCLDLDRYMLGVRRFAELASAIGFVRYEAVCASPATAIAEICARLDLAFDPSFIDRYANWTRVTGDMGPVADTRGGGAVRDIPRRPVAPALLERLADQPDYRAALRILGYEHEEPTRRAACAEGVAPGA
jgi:hypothetical protein